MASFLLEKGSKLSLFRCDEKMQEHCFFTCQARILIHKLDRDKPLQK